MRKNVTAAMLLLILVFSVMQSCSKIEDDSVPPVVVAAGATKAVAVSIAFPESNFTDPDVIFKQSKASYNILNRLGKMIDAVPIGDSLFMSMYLLSHPTIITALKNAHARGVVTNILVDSSRTESITANLVAYADLAYIPTYTTVRNDNNNNEAINHNKFVAFSAILTTQGVKKNVVFQTSNNMIDIQCTYYQDNFIIQNEGLYNKYREVWHDIKKYAKSGMINFNFNEYDEPAAGIHAYFFPKTKNTSYFEPDPVVDILDSITDASKTTIRILMYNWAASRIAIANRLLDLTNKGAKVEVIACTGGLDAAVETVLNQIVAKGGYLRKFYEYGSVTKTVHSKCMLIEGEWKGKSATVIATGSENYTGGALKLNNETLVTLLNSSLYPSYYLNFNKIKNL